MFKYGIACAALIFAVSANAGVPVVGVEVGVSTVKQVREKLAGQTAINDEGINNYSGGVQFKTDGAGYGIDNLEGVTYIFDQQDKLSVVLMTVSKHRFNELFGVLSKKYKVVSQQRPFVGDQFGRFKTADTTIELDAPHMSFEMTVRYLRDDFIKAFKTKSAEESRKKKAAESSKF